MSETILLMDSLEEESIEEENESQNRITRRDEEEGRLVEGTAIVTLRPDDRC